MADEKTFTQDEVDAAIADAKEKQDAKNAELLDEVKKLKAEVRKAKDIDPADLTAAEERADKAEKALADAQKEVKTLTTRAEKAEKALETEGAFTQKLLIQDGLKSALLANGVKDEDFIDSLSAKFAAGAKVVVEGEERKAMYGDKPLGDFIKEWAGTDQGKKFVAAPTNSGGGGPGSKVKADAKTMTREQYNALDQNAKADAGMQSAKGDLVITD